MSPPADDYPRLAARTQNFTLGLPRTFTVAPDGSRVAFLRSLAGDDPVNRLWVFDVEEAVERLVFDPSDVGDADERLPEAERDRRERARERAGGIVAYATDRDLRRAVFVLSGRPFLADMVAGGAEPLPAPGPVDDPRLDPDGNRIAFVVGGNLHVQEIGGAGRVLAADDDPDVSWGLAEFVAAEEMRRFRGHWWSPDGSYLAAARVDERPVSVWHLSNPTDPAARPRAVRYPAAGTDDAIVTLSVFAVGTGERTDVRWDRPAFPYLARVAWERGSPLTLLVQSRDQRSTQLLEVDERTGATEVVEERRDPAWIDLAEDAPVRLADGRVVTVVADHETDTYRLAVDGAYASPSRLQVAGVLAAVGDAVLFTAWEEPTQVHLWRLTPGSPPQRLSHAPGVHGGAGAGEVLVRVSATLEDPRSAVEVVRGGRRVGSIESFAIRAPVEAHPTFLTLGSRELSAALLVPGGIEPDRPLPVLMDPYGGPHAQRVLRAQGSHLTSQWFADQGFAVLVVDGRGTPGRGPAWDRTVYGDLTVALEDQVDGLHAAAERFRFLDLTRVAIRGWSFGGYLSAMAVLRRPDVFHAGIAGAPVTEWRLYDTHYTERYLGHPDFEPDAYARSSLLDDAPRLIRPLLLVHGLSDDNVVPAHTLRLSAALFEAGREHELLLLPTASHMTRSNVTTENLLRVQLAFLRRSLGPPEG